MTRIKLDTPTTRQIEGPIRVHDYPMADKHVRRNRPRNEPVTLLRGRVRESTSKAVHDAAASSGVSVSLYLELLMQRIRHQEGALPVLETPDSNNPEELPISA